MFRSGRAFICWIFAVLVPDICFGDMSYPGVDHWRDILSWLTFDIVPLVLPVWVIFFFFKKKTITRMREKKYAGLTFMTMFIWIYWVYFELTSSRSAYFYSTDTNDYFRGAVTLLGPLGVYYLGVSSSFADKIWLKLTGVLVLLFGLLFYFFNAMFPI